MSVVYWGRGGGGGGGHFEICVNVKLNLAIC